MLDRLIGFFLSEERPAHWYLWVGISTVFMWCFFWWSVGLAPPAFGEGFARAEQVNNIRVLLLEQSLIDLRIRHCRAEGIDPKTFYWDRLQRQVREYQGITKQRFPVPPCSDVGT